MLIFFFLTLTYGTMCPTARDNLLQCFRELLDTNKDSTITVGEIDSFLATQTCINKKITDHLSGEILIHTCDINHDGVLTVADWTASNSCVTMPGREDLVCELCKKCGWSGLKK